MLPQSDFIAAIRTAIPKFSPRPGGTPAPDPEQEACILHDPRAPLQIVAGPGSGKTTVLVLRALRLVVVDGLLPENILLTTFTTKAAAEIRTRLIEWGHALIDHLRANGSTTLKTHLSRVDVNRFMTGTLDSICEEALRSMRSPTDAAPVVIEGFAANVIMHRRGLSTRAYIQGAIEPSVGTYLSRFTFEGDPPGNVAELMDVVRPLFDRFSHDLVEPPRFAGIASHAQARSLLADSYSAYVAEMLNNNRLDFALLEREFLERLRGGRLSRFTDNIRAVLVDEYQDTNLLQESIYFEILRVSSSSLTVVGDDDQSLYRFRGATVELFRDFRNRLIAVAPDAARASARIDLFRNYRSSPEIVAFFNSFIANDPDFAGARVQPPKPAIVATRPPSMLPVLGLFRSDAASVASALATFMHDVFRGPGRTINGAHLIRDRDGDFGDAVFLSHSVNEFGNSFMGQPPRARLPHLLRNELANRGARVFNPRGQHLRDVQDVRQLIGAMLECIDPGSAVQGAMRLRRSSIDYLNHFRQAYQQYASTRPMPQAPHGLAEFVAAWGARRPQSTTLWPREWPVLELCFTLLTWFPRLQNDPEGQVHLEAITRAISQSATFSPFKALVLVANETLNRRSIESALRDIFSPLAENLIDVDEEVMPSVPRDRLGMMTIHQAKGLEYPLVIVDVSSDYSTNHPKNRFKRFPEDPSNVAAIEDDLAPVCDVGPLRQQRTAIQRTFEDLIRLYYVAYSRPQSALLLVGIDKSLQYQSTIRHVATFWRRSGTWPWQGPYTTKKPPSQVNRLPLELI